jgi:hypothetical protein
MSDARGRRTTVIILFLLLGLPPGLCSLHFAPETLLELRGTSPEDKLFYGMVSAVLCLIGFVMFAIFLGLMIRERQRESR